MVGLSQVLRSDRRKIVTGVALLLLLALALAMRLQGWSRIDHPDESSLLKMTMHFHERQFPDGAYPFYPGYPPFFLYLNYLLSLIYQKILLFLGVIRFPGQFLHSTSGNDFILMAGRIISALAGTAFVALAWRMGKSFFNSASAWFAALLMTVNSFLVYDSHVFKPDMLLALLLFASLLYALKYDQSPQRRWLFLSSFFFGLAVATKYHAVVELLFLLPAFAIAARRDHRPLRETLFLAPVAMSCGFFFGAPNWVVHPFLNIAAAYRFITYHYAAFRFYEKKLAYSAFFKTILGSFGPVLFAFLLIGLIAVFVNRQRTALLLAAYVGVYVIILGNTSYFGTRMLLPILPAMALLIAGTLFDILPRLLQNFGKVSRFYLPLVWALLAIYFLHGALMSFRHYNLLHSASTFQQASDYRFRHIPAGHSLAHENLTPGFAGDLGFSDLTEIPLQRFRGPNAVHFICSGLFSRFILEETSNPLVKNKLLHRLSHYAVIQRIHKPRFSSFDDDIVFWYKKPYWVGKLNLDRPLQHLPRLFSLPPAKLPSDTCFLPLQNFEKSPLVGKTTNGIWIKNLYCSRPLASLTFFFHAPSPGKVLQISVNGKKEKVILTQGSQVRRVEITGFRPRCLHQDFIYSLALTIDANGLPVSLACVPVFRSAPEMALETPLFNRPQSDPFHEPFSNAEAPSWCQEIYRVYGIDPSFYCLAQSEKLYSNLVFSVNDVTLDDFPLTVGEYVLRIQGQKIIPTQPLSGNLKLTWRSIGLKKTNGGEILFSPAEMESGIMRPFAVDEMTFVQFSIKGQGASNFLVKEFSVEPDFLAFINAYLVEK
jgi:hypothetical protein